MTMPLTSPAKNSTKSSAVRRVIQKSWRWLLGVLSLALAWHALRGVAWPGVGDLLAGIGPLAFLIILSINLLMIPLMTARWWLLLRALGSPVGLLSACAYRTAANAISYLTPGPHFGGEPLSVYLLHQRQGIPLSTATTSVAVDRLLELLASFVILSFCLINLVLAESSPFAGSQGLSIILAVPVVCIFVLVALFTGGRPLSRLVFLFERFRRRYIPKIFCNTVQLIGIISQGETMAESLYRLHRYQFLLFVSSIQTCRMNLFLK